MGWRGGSGRYSAQVPTDYACGPPPQSPQLPWPPGCADRGNTLYCGAAPVHENPPSLPPSIFPEATPFPYAHPDGNPFAQSGAPLQSYGGSYYAQQPATAAGRRTDYQLFPHPDHYPECNVAAAAATSPGLWAYPEPSAATDWHDEGYGVNDLPTSPPAAMADARPAWLPSLPTSTHTTAVADCFAGSNDLPCATTAGDSLAFADQFLSPATGAEEKVVFGGVNSSEGGAAAAAAEAAVTSALLDDADDDDATLLRDHMRQSARHMSSARRSALYTLSAHKRRVYGQPLGKLSSGCSLSGNDMTGSGRNQFFIHDTNPAAPTANTATSSSTAIGRTSGAAAGTTATAAADIDEDESCIVAVINNGAKEVGVALVSFPALSISIAQFGDTVTYTKSLSLLHCRNPVEVLLPSTTLEEPLTKILLHHFREEMTFTSVPRRHFASERGVAQLNRLKSTQEMTPSIEDTDRYLCTAAANALILYVESISDMPFMPGSVRVRAIPLNNFADLPRSAARALHIISPSGGYTGSLQPASKAGWGARGVAVQPPRTRNGSSSSNTATVPTMAGLNTRLETVTLVEAMPRACTPMGQRLLRSSLVQPLKSLRAIEDRLDAVEWLMADPAGRLSGLRRRLLRLSGGLDMERMSSIVSYSSSVRLVTAAADPRGVHDASPRDAADYHCGDVNPAAAGGGGGDGEDPLNAAVGAGAHWNPQQTLLQQQQQQQQLAALYVERNKRTVGCLMDYWECVEVLTDIEQALSRILPDPMGMTSGLGETHAGGLEGLEEEGSADGPTSRRSNTALPTSSSPANPRLLQKLLTAMRACDLAGLQAALERHLDGAVRERRPLPPSGAMGMGFTLIASGDGDARRASAAADSFFLQQPLQQSSLFYGGRTDSGTHTGRASGRQRARDTRAKQHHRLARMAFAVLSPAGSALDMARSRYSEQIRCITEYYISLCTAYQMHTLRLEPDPAGQLFYLSYAAMEEAKTVNGPFRDKYSGGNHFALYKRHMHARALEQQRIKQQQSQQAVSGDCRHSNGGCSDQWGTHSLQMSESSVRGDWPYAEDSAEEDEASDCGGGDGAAEESVSRAQTRQCPDGETACSAHPLSARRAVPEAFPQKHLAADLVDSRRSSKRQRTVRVRCSTERLTTLCQEASEYLHSIFAEEVARADPLLKELRARLGGIQAMTEAVALLDMLLSFAVYSFTNNCTRPTLWLGDEGEESKNDAREDRDAPEDAFRRHDDRISDCGNGAVVRDAESVTISNRKQAPLFSWEGGTEAGNGGVSLSIAAATAGDGDAVCDTPTRTAVTTGPPAATSMATSRGQSARLQTEHDHDRRLICAYRQRQQPNQQRQQQQPQRGQQAPLHREGCICLEGARHPSQSPSQLAQLRGGGTNSYAQLSARITANTISWADGVRVLVITGPNATGKSTLLRIVGQLYTLAQCGCFVPCVRADMRIVDRILAHMLCDELPSPQYASQSRELMELAEITHAATAHSLVLVDELGRSMTSREGSVLARATVEWLRRCAKSQTVFATHYAELSRVASLCTDVGNAHFSLVSATAELKRDTGPRRTVMCVSHALRPGACTSIGYGLQAAAALGFYPPVLELARALRETEGPLPPMLPPYPQRTISADRGTNAVGTGATVENEMSTPRETPATRDCSDNHRSAAAIALADNEDAINASDTKTLEQSPSGRV